MRSLAIDRLDPVTGHGVVFDDGAALSVPLTLPGDIVAVEGGEVRLIAADSPLRQTPPCPHFAACGGCQLQHMRDDALADWKRGIVADALARHGVEADIRPTVTVPPASRRRARFTLQRTKKGASFGFLAAGTHRVIDLDACPVLDPALLAALPDLKAIALAGAPRKRAVTLHVTRTDSGLDVLAEGMKALDLPLRETLARLADRADLARLSWNGDILAERRPPALRFGPATVHPAPGAFLQAVRETEGIVLDLLRDALDGARAVADLFCGCGTFALPLAERAAVTAVDSEAPAIAALDRAARACPALRPVTARVRDLFRAPLMPDELAGFDAVVLDPPRAGAKAQVAALAGSRVPLVAMVSCNPATFARDAAALTAGGYRAGTVVPIDQFRWSPHTEVVGLFRHP